MSEHGETACPRCSEPAVGTRFCPSCGLKLEQVPEMATAPAREVHDAAPQLVQEPLEEVRAPEVVAASAPAAVEAPAPRWWEVQDTVAAPAEEPPAVVRFELTPGIEHNEPELGEQFSEAAPVEHVFAEASVEPVVEDALEQPVVEDALEQPVVEEALEEPVVEEASEEPVIEEVSEEPVFEQPLIEPDPEPNLALVFASEPASDEPGFEVPEFDLEAFADHGEPLAAEPEAQPVVPEPEVQPVAEEPDVQPVASEPVYVPVTPQPVDDDSRSRQVAFLCLVALLALIVLSPARRPRG